MFKATTTIISFSRTTVLKRLASQIFKSYFQVYSFGFSQNLFAAYASINSVNFSNWIFHLHSHFSFGNGFIFTSNFTIILNNFLHWISVFNRHNSTKHFSGFIHFFICFSSVNLNKIDFQVLKRSNIHVSVTAVGEMGMAYS